MAEQDGEALSLAAYFAKVLQIKGLHLRALGIDERPVDIPFDLVRSGKQSYRLSIL